MKFVTGKNWRNPEKNYLDSLSSTTKLTWIDRDVNSGPHRGGRRATNPFRHEVAPNSSIYYKSGFFKV